VAGVENLLISINRAAAASAITPTDLGGAVGDAQRLVRKLAKTNPTLRAELYQGLGVQAVYLPESNEVELVAQPIACSTVRVEGTFPPTTRETVLDLAA
jgi:hypothetical protein